jgi:hypothetical protein
MTIHRPAAGGRIAFQPARRRALVTILLGYALFVLTQLLVFPLFGVQLPLPDQLALGVVFTAVLPPVRAFLLRQLFPIGLREDAAAGTAGPRARRPHRPF